MNQTPKSVYLDYAAATPLDPRVFKAMEPHLTTEFANPSSLYPAARKARQAVEDARRQVASLLGAKPTEIIWTSSGTESNNLAIQGVLRAHPGAHWITSAIEHDAVLACADPMRTASHEITIIPVSARGIVDTQALAAAISDETVLISIMLANNEIGTVQPVADIAAIIAGVRADRAKRHVDRPLYLHTDACQAAGYLDLQVSRLQVDLLSLNGSKLYGPKGSGLLYVRHAVTLEPLLYGGGQERGRRSGTENVAGIVGLATALELAAAERKAESRRLAGLRDQLIQRLQAAIPNASLNGDPVRRLPANISLTIPGAEGEAMVLYLASAGIMASTGSACSTGDLDPSHVLLAIGRTPEEAQSSLRLTLGRSTDQVAVDYVAQTLPPIIQRLRELRNN